MNYESGPMVHVKIDRDVFSGRRKKTLGFDIRLVRTGFLLILEDVC